MAHGLQVVGDDVVITVGGQEFRLHKPYLVEVQCDDRRQYHETDICGERYRQLVMP